MKASGQLRLAIRRFLPLYIFIFLFLFFAFFSGIFVIASLLVPTSFLIGQRLLYVSPSIIDGIQLSGLGFILPSFLTLTSLVLFRPSLTQTQMTKRGFHQSVIILLCLVVVSVSLSLFVPEGLIPKSVGGTDSVLALSISGFLSFMVWKGQGSLAIRWAFPLGFVLGLVSDFESLKVINGAVFGGNGLFDGDFFEPFAMVVATWASRRTFRR